MFTFTKRLLEIMYLLSLIKTIPKATNFALKYVLLMHG